VGVRLAAPRVFGLGAAAFAFAVDQADKWWMLSVFDIEHRPPVRVLPVLDIVMAWNRGISYGMFTAGSEIGRWALVVFTLAAVGFFAAWMWRLPGRIAATGCGLVVGAGLANACDRLLRGAVADFFHFHTPFWLGPLSNYVFNLADVAIVAGAGLLMYDFIFVNAQKSTGSGDAAPHSP
jgi:signal peptidase II